MDRQWVIGWVIVAALALHAGAGVVRADDASTAAYARGTTLLRAYEYAQALEAYETALLTAEASQRTQILLQIGTCHQRLHKYEQAIARYDEVLARQDATDAVRAEAHLGSGYCYNLQRKTEPALEHLRAAIGIAGAAPDTRNNAALYAAYASNREGETEQALHFFEQAAACEGAHPVHIASGLLGAAKMHVVLGNFDQARQLCEQIIKLPGAGQRAVSARTQLEELAFRARPPTALFIEPYVTHGSGTAATIRWVSKGHADPGQVAVTGPGLATALVVKPQSAPLSEEGYAHQTAEISGLTPGQTYHYTVTSETGTATGSFKTAPSAAIPFTFAVLGDTQTRASVHAAIADHLAQQEPAFVVLVGDLVEQGPVWFQWKSQLFDPGRPYLRKAVFHAVRGNHDGGPFFPALFGQRGRQHYSFDYANVHVIVLDSFGPHASGKAKLEQARWFEADLAKTDKTWKIVALHDPMVNNDSRNDWWGEEHFLPLVEKYGVDLVLSGHHHLYRRFVPLGKVGDKPVLHITTGGAGGGLGGNPASPLIAHAALTHHFLRFDVDGQTLAMQAIDQAGHVIDRLTLTKHDGRYQQEVMAATVDRDMARSVASFYYRLLGPKSDHRMRGSITPATPPDVPSTPDAPDAPESAMRVTIDLKALPTGMLDYAALPEGMRVTVESTEQSAWHVPAQSMNPHDGALVFTATPRTATADGAARPVEVMLNVMLDGRAMRAHRFVISVDGPTAPGE